MKKNDVTIFKQAFDELEEEGYFNDISSKIKQTSVQRSSSSVAVSPKASYTVKKNRSSNSIKKN